MVSDSSIVCVCTLPQFCRGRGETAGFHPVPSSFRFQAAGVPKKLAPTIGIAVDHRRRNRSLEGLQTNIQRLKTYEAKLVILPRRAKKVKVNLKIIILCPAKELATATRVHTCLLITREQLAVDLVKVPDEMKSFNAYGKLRIERTNARHIGARLKRAAEAEKK
uniref:60S ribosomal protein L13-2-like n=1 Tax=Nicotiana sylvestris TaxID=4096 RepID=A0A1U7UWG6_NICSY|nr:PREDICTED: 60S ribosomal protein L13-2-like [Nicotiana sylvestris]